MSNRSNRRTYRDERAVSPVVGVSLLIGITVILAAVVGTVVLGVGVEGTEAPEVTLSFEVESDNVIVVHEGGEPLRTDSIVIRDTNGTEYQLDSNLVTGERGTVVDTDGNPLDLSTTNVERITVVWQGEETERVLATFRP